MCANFKRRQEKRTASLSPLSCVFSMVPSMLLYKLLFLQLESLTCYLMLIRTEQLHFCMYNTWRSEQSKLFGLFFIISSWGGAGLRGLHVLSSWGPACTGWPLGLRGVPWCWQQSLQKQHCNLIDGHCVAGEGQNCLVRWWLARLMSQEKVKGECDSSLALPCILSARRWLRTCSGLRVLLWLHLGWMSAVHWQLISVLFMAGS